MLQSQNYDDIRRISEENGITTYKAIRRIDHIPVIVMIPSSKHQEAAIITGFNHEYDISHKLNSENIVKIYEIDSINNTFALIKEDFGGVSLEQLIGINHFNLQEFLSISIKITEALNDLHNSDIIHNNINPSSILVNPENNTVKITNLQLALPVSQEHKAIHFMQQTGTTLEFISPEQTGRMNRQVDYRTDFYSLGITLYQVLLGRLPFEAQDNLGFIHSHLAVKPIPPHEINPEISPVISEILMKLMEKAAEERYQSASGLLQDLTRCLKQLEKNGKIEAFRLGADDITDKFQIPQKLYGREEQLELMYSAFERISQGGKELQMVTGYTGIGKSSLIYELRKPIIQKNGYFITGKYDQFQHNIPYSALIQAFKELVRQILTQSETEIEAWKRKLTCTLGQNAGLVSEIIPEIQLIIGDQPVPPELPPEESKNRFNMVFQKFVRVFCGSEYPLVIFLDDLQWADLSSLKLLEALISDVDLKYILLIGAYRDNEVNETHPLLFTLNNLQTENTPVNTIRLRPIDLAHIQQILAESFKHELEAVSELAELCIQKTEGNPFFLNQFLYALYQENLICFDIDRHRWRWDLPAIRNAGLTDNVVDLIANRIRKLDPDVREVLKIAACIGNKFDLKTLSFIRNKPLNETYDDLQQALQEGILSGDFLVDDQSKMDKMYFAFLHDRVQQAAYSLIAEADRPKVHLTIGRLMLSNTGSQQIEEKLLDIVNQLNLGIDLIEDIAEKESIAQFELLAGRKAKKAIAYEAAYQYFKIGASLVNGWGWENQYELTLALYLEAGETAYLNGDFVAVDYYTDMAINQSKAVLDKIRAYEVKIAAYSAQTRLKEAMVTGLLAFKLVGVDFPKKPGRLDVLIALAKTKINLAGKQPEDLINMAQMTDSFALAADRLINSIIFPAYFWDPNFFVLVILKGIELYIKFGNSAISDSIYVGLGLVLCSIGDIDLGYRFGEFSLKHQAKFPTNQNGVHSLAAFYMFIAFWKKRLPEVLPFFIQIYHQGLDTGNLKYACIGAFQYCHHSFFAGKDLAVLEKEIAIYSEAILKTKYKETLYMQLRLHQLVLNLLGSNEDVSILKGKAYDRDLMLPLHIKENDLNSLGGLYLCELSLCYIFGDYQKAMENGSKAKKYIKSIRGAMSANHVYLFDSLAMLAAYDGLPTIRRCQIFQKVAANQKRLKKWARYAPQHFLHQYYLVEAEKARVLKKDQKATAYYEKAIQLAAENEYLLEEAMAHELAARFHYSRGNERLARFYMDDAYSCYHQWGAVAKIRQLKKEYPRLTYESNRKVFPAVFNSMNEAVVTSEMAITEKLDLATIKKASQAISGEIILEDLLKQLIELVLENAGAQRVLLILKRENELLIEASGVLTQNRKIDILQAKPVQGSVELPGSIVNYVTRTMESVILDDAAKAEHFMSDLYIKRTQPKSILCMPIIKQGELRGLLYLENNLVNGAFTEDRVIILNILASQLAISIENALFYSRLDELVNQRTNELARELEDLKKTEDRYGGKLVAGLAREVNIPHLENLHNLKRTVTEIKSNLIHPLELADNHRVLSKREAEVAELLCRRMSMTEIATELKLSPRTIQDYVENIKDKLGVRTKRELLEKLLKEEG